MIFNHYSFSVLVKQIMVKYGGRTLQEAEKLFDESGLAVRPMYYEQVVAVSHDLPYHWAMLYSYGNMYWLRGVPSDFNAFADEYLAWEREVMEKHNLNPPFIFCESGDDCKYYGIN